jgi:O-antigen/teichoic acid export membrane protein
MPVLLGGHNQALVSDARLYLLFILLFIFIGLAYHPLRGTGHFLAFNILRTLPSVLWLVVLATAWSINAPRPGPIVTFFLASQALLLLPLGFAVRRLVAKPFRIEKKLFRPLIRFGWPTMLTTLPVNLTLELDQLLLVSLVSQRKLGLYVIAVTWSAIVNAFMNAIGIVVMPNVAAELDRNRQVELLGRSCRSGVVIGLIVGGPLAACTPFVLPIVYGQSFRGAIPAALVLIPAAIIFGWAFILGEGLRGMGYPKKVLWAYLIGLTATLATLLALLPSIGIVGASVSSVIGYGAVGVAELWQIVKITNSPVAPMLIPKVSDIRVIVSAVGRMLTESRRGLPSKIIS